MSLKAYKGTETFFLLVKNIEVSGIVDDWLERNIESDIKIRRAKDNGYRIIETKDLWYANTILRSHPSSRVHIKE